MATVSSVRPDGVEIRGPVNEAYGEILTEQALKFLADLSRRFEGVRQERLQARVARQREIDSGKMPDFPSETAAIREKAWTVAPIPKDLLDRRVEITGPVDRKMVINA